MPLLDLSETDFAILYLLLLMLAGSIAAVLRWFLCQSADDSALTAHTLSATEVAYLAGGVDLTLSATVASLLHRGVLVRDPETSRLTVRENYLCGGSAEEYAVLAALGPKAESVPGGVRGCLERSLEPVRQRLFDAGLLVSPRRAWWARWSALLLVSWVPLLALAKLVYDLVDLEWDKSAALLGLVPLPALLYIFGRLPHRSSRGDTVLRQLREEQTALRFEAERLPGMLSRDQIALVLALFGIEALRNWPMVRELQALLHPRALSGGQDGLTLFVTAFDHVVTKLLEDEVDVTTP